MTDAPFDMPGADASFEERGGWVIRRLMDDLGLTPEQAAGIVGNLGGESGMKAINERVPMVSGSRGGFGWAQWTGPRRVTFEQWCEQHSLDQRSDEANYGFLLYELRGSQAHTVEQLKKTTTVEAAVYTVEVVFERPSDPEGGLASRNEFAQRALDGYGNLVPTAPGPAPAPSLPTTTPAPSSDSDAAAEELNRQELERLAGKAALDTAARLASRPIPIPAPALAAAAPAPVPVANPLPIVDLPAARTAPGVAVAGGVGFLAALATTLQYIGAMTPLATMTDGQATAIATALSIGGATLFHLWANGRRSK